ncbi:hypothetical protein AB0G04_17760 [Actinoplanes sp. NPDC023801]|uniref:hypothetical protein n=1 Tax=Actinoplanes sp. NPDC023801 TaxID=3154595 RepID=UPI0033C82E96
MVLGRRFMAVFSVLVLSLMLPAASTVRAEHLEPRRADSAGGPPELPGDGVSPMLLAAIGGYLLTGGLALLLLRR